jgi:hypothetical protein
MEINLNELKSFVFDASRATYASGDMSIKQTQPDGSTAILYEKGSYRFHDNYFGGEPYGGREVVFLDDKPIWMMVYYGLVHEGVTAKGIYSFLMESLSNSTLAMPYRGPTSFENGSFKYENNLSGDITRFSGVEKIFMNGECVYEASYMGGLVDK